MITPLKDSERTKCEVYTRVMGYHRPVSCFNIGKKQEHKDRRLFVELHERNTVQSFAG